MTSFTSSGRWVLVAVACAAISLPVTAALAATHAPRQATGAPSSVAPRCRIAHPDLPGGAFVWSSSIGDNFAGGAGYQVEITNVGHHPCTLKGVPGVAAVRNGRIVGTRLPGSSRGPLITLQPRATAHVSLTVEDAGSFCAHPVTAEVDLYLSGHKTGQDTFLSALACPGKPGGGVLRVSVITAGAGIPLYDS